MKKNYKKIFVLSLNMLPFKNHLTLLSAVYYESKFEN